MDAVICPDEIQKELNLYCAKMKARELSEAEVWENRKGNPYPLHLHYVCSAHAMKCESVKALALPIAWLLFAPLIALALGALGINWPAFVVRHPYWFVCAVLPFCGAVWHSFGETVSAIAWKLYARMVFNRCRECRKSYCNPYLLEQEKKSGLRKSVVAMIIRYWDHVQRFHSMSDEIVLTNLGLYWNDPEHLMVRDIFKEIAKFIPEFVVDEPPGTYRLAYKPVPALNT